LCNNRNHTNKANIPTNAHRRSDGIRLHWDSSAINRGDTRLFLPVHLRKSMTTRFSAKWLESHRVDVSTLRRSDVVGIGHVLAEIDALVARLRDPARAAAMGVEPPRGILFWGEPGLGKTHVARYVAAALSTGSVDGVVPFYEVSADELSPDRIRGAMRYLATTHPRSILYIDECDTFGMTRDYGGHDHESRLLLTATLAALDGLQTTQGAVVIASSNRAPAFLDRALVRAGRLGFKVRFDAPDEDERVALFALFTRTIPCEPGIDWRNAARLTRGKSPADLKQIVADAAGLALADDRDTTGEPDIIGAIRRDGLIEPEDTLGAAALHRVAVHESGHVAVCVALRPGWVYSVRMGPRDGATAFGDEAVPADHTPDDEVRDALAVCFGGIAAEIAVLGEGTRGGRSDVSDATEKSLARITAGLTDGLTPIDFDWLDKNVAESLKQARAVELLAQVNAARVLATAIVNANVVAIRRFAATLEVAGELTGEALETAIDSAGFRRAEER
jgi:cell division protease FtsH